MQRDQRRMVRALALLAMSGALGALAPLAHAQITHGKGKFDQPDKFRQLEEILPTPTEVRLASGAPGPEYWQQRADYDIDVELDDQSQRITGSEKISYHNNSPHQLHYLWLQLDQNLFERGSDAALVETAPGFLQADDRSPSFIDERRSGKLGFKGLRRLLAMENSTNGHRITRVADAQGNALPYVIVKTMMRIDLPRVLEAGQTEVFQIDWNFDIIDAKAIPSRQGYEFFEDDGNYIYEIAHWFPRMAAYTDVNGWQHKQFLGRGEFTLEFGNYTVRITVPDDHIVGATGVLQNPAQVLSQTQRDRLREAESAPAPVFIVTPDEALQAEKNTPTGAKTWVFAAQNVRDFAFATSRKFIWDAQGHYADGGRVMAMSFYPKEGEPLWSKYSTHAIIHTLNVYSSFTFNYPYPTAISINGPIGGMEYPMICFNGPRPEDDGTYSKRTKYGLISVIIHEVGHNYFPMVVNSDERQWTWMDEGFNTFCQYLAEQQWEDDYPSRRGEPKDIVEYMKSRNQVPIMTNSESLLQFGNNAYAKTATALNILRETILGRELFDFAFKEYARRWEFKRPQPADFFRTMEDASGIDLDWFWRGWFYSTDHTDIAIDNVRLLRMDTGDPSIDNPLHKADKDDEPVTQSDARNKAIAKRLEEFPELKDFYNDFDDLNVTEKDLDEYKKWYDKLDDWEKQFLKLDSMFYVVDLRNIGGLVMPVIMGIEYADGSTEELRIPAEIWKQNSERVSKLILARQEIRSIILDPHLETADVDLSNNNWPRKPVESRFKLFKQKKRKNPMQIERDWTEQDEDAQPTAADPGDQQPDSGAQ